MLDYFTRDNIIYPAALFAPNTVIVSGGKKYFVFYSEDNGNQWVVI